MIRLPRRPASAHRPAFTRAPLTAALLAVLPLSALPAHAAVTAVGYTLEADGTPDAGPTPWDATDGPGLDSGPRNGRVRTHDEVIYRVSLSYTGGTQQARIVLTLPRQANGSPMAEWPRSLENCAEGSGVSADRQTLTCLMTERKGSGTLATDFRARVLGTVPNGASLPAPDIEVRSEGEAPVTPPAVPAALTVSAAPFYDVVIQNTFPGDPKAYAYQEAGGPEKRDGYYHRLLVGLMAYHPHGRGKKGVEALSPAHPVIIDLDVSGYPASVRLDNWRDTGNTAPGDLPTGVFATGHGCGSTWVTGSTPGRLAGYALNMYQRVLDMGPESSTGPSIVANGGTCTATRTSDGLPDNQRVQIRITGIDTALSHTPVRTLGNLPLDAAELWVSNKAVILWTDLADYPVNTPVDHTLKLAGISGQSLSGQPIQNLRIQNDEFPYKLTNKLEGTPNTIWHPDTSLSLAEGGTLRDPANQADGIVNYIAHGQHVSSRISFTNRGSIAYRNLTLCGVLDRSALDIGTHFRAYDAYEGLNDVGTISYGVRAGSPYFASTDSASSPLNNVSSPTGTSAYSLAGCDAPDIIWHNSLRDALAAGGPTYIRTMMPKLPGGKGYHLFLEGMKIRDTWASTVTVEAPVAGVRTKGEPIADGTVLRIHGWATADNMPEVEKRQSARVRDHLEIRRVRTVARIKNSIIDPAVTASQPLPAGQMLTYRIEPRYSSLLPPSPGTVTVTELLPDGLIYEAGQSTVGGQPSEPRVERDTATGATRLVWTYENVSPHFGPDTDTEAALPPITYKARISRRTLNGSVLHTRSLISDGEHGDVPDCEPTGSSSCVKLAESQVRIETLPGFVLEKSASPAQIEPGDDFTYRIDFYPMARALQTPDVPDLIDILPHAGDGTAESGRSFGGRNPASTFDAGAYFLKDVEKPAIDPGMEVYYTSRAPREIHNDPRHASNAIPGGSTRWCRSAELGTPGCPPTKADATAVRSSPSITSLAANQPYGMTLHLGTHPVIARGGNMLANRAAARPDNSASTLTLTVSDSNIHTRVVAPPADKIASLSGRVFVDMDGEANASAEHNLPLAGQCMSLAGTDDRGRAIEVSTRTDTDGRYSFEAGSAGPFFASTGCTGTALTALGGIRGGTYTLTRVTEKSRDNATPAPAPGAAGGEPDTTAQVIRNIVLEGGKPATNYHFMETPAAPRITLTGALSNTHGGSRTAADITLGATQQNAEGEPIAATKISGKHGDRTISDVQVRAGTWLLESTVMSGYRITGWTCTVTRNTGTGQPTSRTVKADTATLALPLLNGDRAACTLTQADRPATLTLTSTVTNTNGRSNTPADFALTARGPMTSPSPVTLTGTGGAAAVTRVNVMPGEYLLHADNVMDADGQPVYVPSAWSCTASTSPAGNQNAGITHPVTPITADTGTARTGDARVAITNGDDLTCTINHSDSPVSLSLKLEIINQYGGTASSDTHSVSAAGEGKEVHSPKKAESTDPVPVAPGVYKLTGLTLPGYQTGSWSCTGGTLQDTYELNGQTQTGPFLVTGNRANIGCRYVLKDIPASMKVAKTVAGEPALVAGTANEYTVQHVITVTHDGGSDATYDLLDTPAFDPDVEVVSTQITLDDGSDAAGSNAQTLSITPSTRASGGVQWPLASRRVLKLKDAAQNQTGQHVYRMTSRIRVPFGSATTNNGCTTTGSAGGNGLYNAVSLVHYDGAQQPIDSTPQTSNACVATPEPVQSTTLVIDKRSATQRVEVGDLITYRLRIRNTGNAPAISPVVVDILPRGFRYEPGSVRVQNASTAKVELASSRELRITLDRVDPSTTSGNAGGTTGSAAGNSGKDVQITYRLRAGVGSQEGDGINRARIQCVSPRSPSGLADCSNESRWKVQVTPGIFAEEACVAGQIFVDCNGNSIKDREELGIPGVRLYFENGTWLVSDEQGKYSHCGLRPRTHVLKVDRRTLPRRSRLVTSSPQNVGDAESLFIDARKGMLHRADFIEGSCSNTVIEQVKARQAQGPVNAMQTEKGQPALTFDSKQGIPARPRQQGTDGAKQPLSQTRH